VSKKPYGGFPLQVQHLNSGIIILFTHSYSITLKSLILTLLVISITACAYHEVPSKIINEKRLNRVEIQTDQFRLMAYTRIEQAGAPLVVYIEGDGYAWINRSTPSLDPTPRKAMALKLALMDTSPNLVYLARPCQYVKNDQQCGNNRYWTGHRFSPVVIESMNNALDKLKISANAHGIHLVGYSGGGAVAVLLSARRTDVLSLRTIAGNLDTKALNHWHDVSPMPESLNPIDVAQKIKDLPQQHWVGEKDKIVPPFIAASFKAVMGYPTSCEVISINNASHEDGWLEIWSSILQ
jgi:hypothetical protein